ncbi:MAG TPA: LCP family protein [Nocardioides sp.]|uniref:LCP family protein n=1 Tax=Nocardioides sp. TaxID=35761 RepID=UPI002F3EDDD9
MSMPPYGVKPGRRRAGPHRCPSVAHAVGWTLLSAVVPGAGFLHNRRHRLGALVLVVSLGGLGWAAYAAPHGLHSALDLAFDPARLTRAAVLTAICMTLWVAVVVGTFVALRPRPAPHRWHLLGGSAFVGALCLVVVAPVGLVVRDAFAQVHAVNAVFTHNRTATRPTHVTAADPWNGRNRVNVLLLGGDSGPNREGTRTDTMILASLDTRTGRTVTFGLPRNLMDAPFPDDSPLHALYPNGFTGPGDPASWMLNAVYREVPILHPHVLGSSADEGADAIKEAVEGVTGLPVHYYVLVDFTGFRELVDAMGGITVNVNIPVAINGQTDAHIAPTGYIEPGPDQHLDGFHALWYARGRYGADDYQRMARQRCVVNAIIDEANPVNLLRRYQALAAAGSRVVSTDIPKELLPAFVELALRAKDHRAKSVLFRLSTEFNPGAPDFDYMHEVVQKALASQGKHRHHQPSSAQDDNDACAYHPGQSY